MRGKHKLRPGLQGHECHIKSVSFGWQPGVYLRTFRANRQRNDQIVLRGDNLAMC